MPRSAILVRFLQLQQRIVQAVSPDTGGPREVAELSVDGTEYTSWDEAAEREQPGRRRGLRAAAGRTGTWGSTSAQAR